MTLHYFFPSPTPESQVKKAALSLDKHSHVNEDLNIKGVGVEQPWKNSSLEGGQGQAHSRSKRFLSYPRYVEVMVTADARMARQHGQNLQHYVLTLMSIVSRIGHTSAFPEAPSFFQVFVPELQVISHFYPGNISLTFSLQVPRSEPWAAFQGISPSRSLLQPLQPFRLTRALPSSDSHVLVALL